jgi:IS30 family transposase
MDKSYRHLSVEERAVVMIEHRQGGSARRIASLLGRAPSTISRELKRHSLGIGCVVPGSYCATAASVSCRQRRLRSGRRRKLTEGTRLFDHVYCRLVFRRWSPQQIASTLRQMHPDNAEQRVSHETIYASIYAFPRGALKVAMIEALRQRQPQRGRRRSTLARGFVVPEELRIVNRPEEIEGRQVPGHWEGDFIKGAFNRSGVGTLVERKTRFVVLCRMDGCTASAAVQGFTRQMKKLPAVMRESMTYDRGVEMAGHAELAKNLKMDIWFADPHAPWQRGSNENTNGLLRQFMPKGMDLSTLSQSALNDIARLMNTRPRMTLGWKTPAQAMTDEIAASKLRGALET